MRDLRELKYGLGDLIARLITYLSMMNQLMSSKKRPRKYLRTWLRSTEDMNQAIVKIGLLCNVLLPFHNVS